MDVCDMQGEFEEKEFQAVIDKACIDSIYCMEYGAKKARIENSDELSLIFFLIVFSSEALHDSHSKRMIRIMFNAKVKKALNEFDRILVHTGVYICVSCGKYVRTCDDLFHLNFIGSLSTCFL